MKLSDDNSIFNMGDTSLRLKKQVDAYAFILKHLANFSYANLSWKDKNYQEEFYKSIHQAIKRLDIEDDVNLFENFNRVYNIPSDSKVGQRGRTWTNALVKNGLVTSSRQLSPVGNEYLQGKLKPADKLESLILKDENNLLYFRQYLKMRIYAHDATGYFYNFRFAIKFLLQYKNVPKNDFLRIIESIKPTISKEYLDTIIDDYQNVALKIWSFEDYYAKYFEKIMASESQISLAKNMFLTKNFSSESFNLCFPNRKSSLVQELYKYFVLSVIDLVDNQSIQSFESVKRLSKELSIKKAFGFNSVPFIFTKNETVTQFLSKNADNPLLDQDHYKIYQRFLASKRFDLIREYSDMCIRSFRATGLFNFSNGLVNLNHDWLFGALLSVLGEERFEILGKSNQSEYQEYEENINSVWFNDVSLIEIFCLTKEEVDLVLSDIQNNFKISNAESISQFFDDKNEKEYRDFVENKFPKEMVIEILKEINQRNDDRVFELVTDNATIPTIFEYILTIAWYHISESKQYSLYKSFQLTLDGDKLPLTHRGGGYGDIEIVSDDYALLIEATLMNANTQKRGELEPVIRHSVNFKLQHRHCHYVQSLFIANELDMNVLNIFRAMQFVALNGTIDKGKVDGLNIFALTTMDIIKILEENIKDDKILSVIRQNLMNKPMQILNHWVEPIRQQIFCS